MLLEYLERVRQQPKEIRRRFAFTWSLVMTGIIVVLWLSVLYGRSYALQESEPSLEDRKEFDSQNIRASFDGSNDFRSGDTPPALFNPSPTTQAEVILSGTSTVSDIPQEASSESPTSSEFLP